MVALEVEVVVTGIEIWLHSRQRALQGRRPLDLLSEGRFEAVLVAVEQLAGGPRRGPLA